MHTSRPWLGKLLLAIVMTPVIILLPLVLCMLPFYVPAAAYAQFRAARYGLERNNHWGMRLAVGVVYGILQFLLLVSLLKRWGIDPNQAIVLVPAFLAIFGSTYLGMIAGDWIWGTSGAFLLRTFRSLYGVERDEELPPRRVLEAAEWLFYLELPAFVAILVGLCAAQLTS